MNTRISYLYRDTDNYKVYNECVVKGDITGEQKKTILSCLEDEENFIPHKVGLPERRFDKYDPEVDHPWFELQEGGFEPTDCEPTIEMDTDTLVEQFKRWKGKWTLGRFILTIPGPYVRDMQVYVGDPMDEDMAFSENWRDVKYPELFLGEFFSEGADQAKAEAARSLACPAAIIRAIKI